MTDRFEPRIVSTESFEATMDGHPGARFDSTWQGANDARPSVPSNARSRFPNSPQYEHNDRVERPEEEGKRPLPDRPRCRGGPTSPGRRLSKNGLPCQGQFYNRLTFLLGLLSLPTMPATFPCLVFQTLNGFREPSAMLARSMR